MEKEILFDSLTAAEVAERLRIIQENQNSVNLVLLTVARLNGCAPTDRIGLNEKGTGILVYPQLETLPLEEVTNVEEPSAAVSHSGRQKAAK